MGLKTEKNLNFISFKNLNRSWGEEDKIRFEYGSNYNTNFF